MNTFAVQWTQPQYEADFHPNTAYGENYQDCYYLSYWHANRPVVTRLNKANGAKEHEKVWLNLQSYITTAYAKVNAKGDCRDHPKEHHQWRQPSTIFPLPVIPYLWDKLNTPTNGSYSCQSCSCTFRDHSTLNCVFEKCLPSVSL